jgi:hypothetical protein
MMVPWNGSFWTLQLVLCLWLAAAGTPWCAAFSTPIPILLAPSRTRTRIITVPSGRALRFRLFNTAANSDNTPTPTSTTTPAYQAATATAASKCPVVTVLELDGRLFNLTEWAGAHPGGSSILQKFHGKNATKAFHAVGHSPEAFALRESFLVKNDGSNDDDNDDDDPKTTTISSFSLNQTWKRIRQKLFTKEDPGVHKYLGIYVLGHFLYRYSKALSTKDPTAGLGTSTPLPVMLLFLLPHAVLSLSSFLFHVPAERIVGKPMIWQEYRGHNVVFALRSIVCIVLSSVGLRFGHVRGVRLTTMISSLVTVLLTARIADEATTKLRVNNLESTTATMPYWDECTAARQAQFKAFYAISQYGATLACLSTSNPFWPFMVLLPIQLASFQMTLVRKGFMSVKVFHLIYAASLVLPYLISLKHYAVTNMVQIPLSFGAAVALFWLRKQGVNKYWLWSAVGAVRIAAGDLMLPWKIWL